MYKHLQVTHATLILVQETSVCDPKIMTIYICRL